MTTVSPVPRTDKLPICSRPVTHSPLMICDEIQMAWSDMSVGQDCRIVNPVAIPPIQTPEMASVSSIISHRR